MPSGNESTLSGISLIPGLSMLGFGYDIYKSSYCDPGSCTDILLAGLDAAGAQTVKVPGYPGTYLCPSLVRLIMEQPINEDYTIVGKTVEEYTSSLAIKAGVSGSYGAFSGSIKTSYSESEDSYTENAYGEHGHVFSGMTLQLPRRASRLRVALRPELKGALLSKTPKDIIGAYGTHLVSEVVIGAKSLMRMYATRSDVTNTQEWGVAIEAAYGAVSADTSVDSKSRSYISKFKMSHQIQTIGGDNRLIENGSDYKEWLKTVYATPAIVDMRALVPLWQLIDPTTDREKREALRHAIIDYAKSFQIGVTYGVSQRFNNKQSSGAWVEGPESSGRRTAYLGALSWSELYQQGFSESYVWQGTGQEAGATDPPHGMAIYGGRQQKSSYDSAQPWKEMSRWGSSKHPETGRELTELLAAQVFKGQGDYGFGMSRISFFVGPVEEAPASAWVVVGGRQHYQNGANSGWGLASTHRIREQAIAVAHGYNNNNNSFEESAVYLYLREVSQTLPEIAE